MKTTRPSFADFGIYAQLTQLAKFDPMPAAICMKVAPRIHAGTDLVNELSGHTIKASEWMLLEGARDTLGDLLAEIGQVYAPALVANAKALQSGEKLQQQWWTVLCCGCCHNKPFYTGILGGLNGS